MGEASDAFMDGEKERMFPCIANQKNLAPDEVPEMLGAGGINFRRDATKSKAPASEGGRYNGQARAERKKESMR
jgi:hypothetical protein